jgi:hypothetical protein
MFILPESIPVVQEVLVLRFLAVLATVAGAEAILVTLAVQVLGAGAAEPQWCYLTTHW